MVNHTERIGDIRKRKQKGKKSKKERRKKEIEREYFSLNLRTHICKYKHMYIDYRKQE